MGHRGLAEGSPGEAEGTRCRAEVSREDKTDERAGEEALAADVRGAASDTEGRTGGGKGTQPRDNSSACSAQ